MRSLSAVVALLFTFALHAQSIEPRKIDALIEKTMREWQIPGAAIAIVKDDRIVHLQGYGTKALDRTDRVTPDTLFQIASTTKAFTSTALAMLASDGKLTFDDPVRLHVDYFRLADPCADANVTIRDLVSHRTGLARHDELWDNSPFTREELLHRIGRVPLTKPFRSAYQYQNIMYVAAGEVVAGASGVTWDEFVRTRIFEPLGMTRTILSDAAWNDADHAAGYAWNSKTQQLDEQKTIETQTLGAGGAIKSTARDMAQWIRFQLAGGRVNGKPLVDPELLAETKAPHTVIRLQGVTAQVNPETNVLSYAMGWNVQDYRGTLLIAHAGALNGFRTHVDLLPKQNAGFVLMINAGRGYSLIALRNAIADMLLGKPSRDWSAEYLAINREANEKAQRERAERIAKRHAGTTPTLPHAEYAGSYTNDAYGTATISLSGDTLVLQWNRMTIPLEHHHYDVFTAHSPRDYVDEELFFDLTHDRKPASLRIFGQRFTRETTDDTK